MYYSCYALRMIDIEYTYFSMFLDLPIFFFDGLGILAGVGWDFFFLLKSQESSLWGLFVDFVSLGCSQRNTELIKSARL